MEYVGSFTASLLGAIVQPIKFAVELNGPQHMVVWSGFISVIKWIRYDIELEIETNGRKDTTFVSFDRLGIVLSTSNNRLPKTMLDFLGQQVRIVCYLQDSGKTV